MFWYQCERLQCITLVTTSLRICRRKVKIKVPEIHRFENIPSYHLGECSINQHFAIAEGTQTHLTYFNLFKSYSSVHITSLYKDF